MAGMTLLDPREEPNMVLARICQCRIVLSEALHGIIVADALRIPWIAIRPRSPEHRPKWTDWAEGMGLRLRFQPLPSSGFTTKAVRLSQQQHGNVTEQLAAALNTACATEPSLSGDTAIKISQERMLAGLSTLRRRPLGGLVRNVERSRLPGGLHHGRRIA
jgi:succinoglycan biosynthesis protein ExoV